MSQYQDVVFDPDASDGPSAPPSFVRRMPAEERAAWCERETERQRTVAVCEFAIDDQKCGRRLKAGEEIPHMLRHAPNGRIRSAAGTLLNLPRRDALQAIKLAAALAELLPEEG